MTASESYFKMTVDHSWLFLKRLAVHRGLSPNGKLGGKKKVIQQWTIHIGYGKLGRPLNLKTIEG